MIYPVFSASINKTLARLFSPTLILFLILLGATSCQRQEAEELATLRIGHAPHDHHAPLYVAALNPDYFRENGGIYLKEITFRKEYRLISGSRELANVIIDSSTGGKKLIRTLHEQHNDIVFGGVPAMLSFIDQGSEMEILLPVMSEGAGLVVRRDLPISSWGDFVSYVNASDKPLRIGYKTAISNQNLIFETALKSISIPFTKKDSDGSDTGKVTLINLFGAKNLIPAMKNDIIDGFVVNQPFVAMAEQQGAGKMIASLSDLPPVGKWKNSPCCALAGNTKYVARHPEAVESLLALLLRANKFISQNPGKSAQQIAQWLEIDASVELLSLPTIKYTTEYDEDWHRGIQFWVESMINANKLNKNIKTAYKKGELESRIYNTQTFTRAKKLTE